MDISVIQKYLYSFNCPGMESDFDCKLQEEKQIYIPFWLTASYSLVVFTVHVLGEAHVTKRKKKWKYI